MTTDPQIGDIIWQKKGEPFWFDMDNRKKIVD